MRSAMKDYIDELARIEAFVRATIDGEELLAAERSPLQAHFSKHSTPRKQFDNTAFLISSCAALEHFVTALAKGYLERLPRNRPFGALPEKLRESHRISSAKMLQEDLTKPRYEHAKFTHESLAKNLHASLALKKYELNAEAVAQIERNPKAKIIRELFSNIGINAINGRVLLTDPFQAFAPEAVATESDGDPIAINDPLRHLIEARNGVSHRVSVNLMSAKEHLRTIQFLRAYGRGLYIALASECLDEGYRVANTVELKFAETARARHVVICPSPSSPIRCGSTAFIQTDTFVLRWGTVKSLMHNNVSVKRSRPTEAELGVELDFKCPKAGSLFVLPKHDSLLDRSLLEDTVVPSMATS